MRMWVRRPLRSLAGVLAVGLAVASCTASQDPVDVPATPSSTVPTAAPEPSASPEDIALSVVSVEVEQGASTGVVMTSDGYVVTSNNLVEGVADDSITVVFSTGDSSPATVVGRDARSNLAVVKVDGAPDLEPALFGDSEATEIDDEVLVLGSRAGPASGTVRALGSAVDGVSMLEIETSADLDGSGGVLVNGAGEVIGILMATGIVAGDGDGGQVGYAIHANLAARVAEQLAAGEQVTHPYLGVSVGDAPAGGALVQEVAAGSPAEQAGLRSGDVITGLGEHPVDRPDDVLYAVQSGSVGDELTVAFTRDGAEHDAAVTLGQAPID